MIYSYLKPAYRNLRKQGGFTAIHILGLTIGLSACLLIAVKATLRIPVKSLQSE
jgi:putative ABC transport system permease protein